MSVYIKGMEMPTNCEDCIFCDGDACLMHKPDEFRSWAEEYKNCPLAPVPEHGRLIDADAFKKIVASSEHMDAGIFDGKMLYSDHLCVGADYEDVCKAIDETPTIIPASGGTDNE